MTDQGRRLPRRRYAGVLGVAGVLLLILGAVEVRRVAVKSSWHAHVACVAVGDVEQRLQQDFLSDAPADQRYAELFAYFARGFMNHRSAGLGRVQYCGAGSVNSYALNGLEGFARTGPLLAAWLYSGRETVIRDSSDGRGIDLVAVLKAGILSGVNRRSPDYWGPVADFDQRIVEAADIARILWLTRSSVWDTFNADEKLMVTQWLLPATRATTPQNNWILFPIIVDLVVANLTGSGGDSDLLARAHRDFERYKAFYVESGWFLDGSNRIDFYNVWGITYDLFWMAQIDPKFDADFIRGAIRQSAGITQHLISPHGIPIMGRSVCYRTAVPVPILAAEFIDGVDEAPGRARNALDLVWKYFVGHEVLLDGALTQGYFAPDLRFLDNYSGGGSCQWGLRSLVLAFMHAAGDHFWIDRSAALPVEVADYRIEYPKIGWIVTGHVQGGEITVEVLRNTGEIRRPTPYARSDEILETILRRPFRPDNHAVKYDSPVYSSADPFPLRH